MRRRWGRAARSKRRPSASGRILTANHRPPRLEKKRARPNPHLPPPHPPPHPAHAFPFTGLRILGPHWGGHVRRRPARAAPRVRRAGRHQAVQGSVRRLQSGEAGERVCAIEIKPRRNGGGVRRRWGRIVRGRHISTCQPPMAARSGLRPARPHPALGAGHWGFTCGGGRRGCKAVGRAAEGAPKPSRAPQGFNRFAARRFADALFFFVAPTTLPTAGPQNRAPRSPRPGRHGPRPRGGPARPFQQRRPAAPGARGTRELGRRGSG